MDPEKPKPEPKKPDPTSGSSPDEDSARRRVERLTDTGREQRERPGSGSTETGENSGEKSGASGKAGGPPRLTERQRIEAREKRRAERGNRRSAGRGAGARGRGRDSKQHEGIPTGNPLSRGVRATWLEVRRTAGFVWGLILSGLERLGPAIRFVVAGLLALLGAAGTGLARLGRAAGVAISRLGKALLALDRVITPRRAFVAVVAGAGLALVASQFTDFRATEIGQAGYDPILDITRAPRTDVITPIDSHSILLLLVAGVAIAALAGLVMTGRRLFAVAIAAAGAAVVAVSLLIDLPRGLDVAEAEISYSDVAAVLLSGFWIQLGAGLVLTVGGLGLVLLSGRKRQIATDPDTRSRRRSRSAGAGLPKSADAGGVS